MPCLMLNGRNYTGGGSGGDGGSSYTEDTLWSNASGIESTGNGVLISLTGNISDYDVIVLNAGRDNGGGMRKVDAFYLVSDLVIGSPYLRMLNQNDNVHTYFFYTSDSSITVASAYESYPWKLFSVKGLKFGGGGSNYSETNLYTASSTSFVDISVTWSWNDYDAYLFFCNDVNSQTGNPWFITKGIITSLIGTQTTLTFYPYSNASVHYYVTANQLTASSQTQGFYIRQIVGINFGGGSLVHTYSTAEHKVGTWIDGSDVYEKVIVTEFNNATPKYTLDLSSIGGASTMPIFVSHSVLEAMEGSTPIKQIVMPAFSNSGYASISVQHQSSAVIGKAYLTVKYIKLS